MAGELHPAESRGFRELYLFARQVVHHWGGLAGRLEDSAVGDVLSRGAEAARALVHELGPATAAYGLQSKPAAQGAGVTLARQRAAVRDRFLEVNQAARFAVEDLQHVVTLLGYLEVVTRARDHGDLADLVGRWERRLRRLENEARRSVLALGADPDAATQPLDRSPLGRAAHSANFAVGAVGEWVDRKAAERRGS
ncbi:MAG: hypothetical protein M3131_07685 [Actinomycetota bacterium]|nr:hypothetical protein [Actinomycetota bacterium]